MKHIKLCVIFALCYSTIHLLAQLPPELPKGVEIHSYTGWGDCVYLNASERPVQVVIVPDVGGRIVHYSFGEENILFENSASQGKTLAGSGGYLWVGGYQCDVGPDIRGIPTHDQLLLGKYQWSSTRPFFAKVTSEIDSTLGIQMEKEFVVAPDTGDLGLLQRLKNSGKEDKSFCLWDRTACKNGGFVFFPVKSASRYPNGWAALKDKDNMKFFDGVTPNSPEVRVVDGILISETVGKTTRIGSDSDAGWMAYVKGKLLFIKYFPCDPKANYTEEGNTVEFYFDYQILEFGPLSPEHKLTPGQSCEYPEKWVLVGLKKEVTTVEQVRKLVSKVKSSPFKKR